jgi:hypothetical protein
MRITRDLLLNIARSNAEELALQSNDIVSIYLTGSMVKEQPLLGGATDIDLICIHALHPRLPREVIRLANEFHLDVAHYPQSSFTQTRQLRQDAWLGSFLCFNPLCLYDSSHWFEYIQAGVLAQFLQPTYVIQRARPFAQQARQIWQQLVSNQMEPTARRICEYCKALEFAGNAFACLVGVPLTERRYILELSERAQALARPGLASGLVDLIAPQDGGELVWQVWLEEWRKAILVANEKKQCPVKLNPIRLPYYENAILVLTEENRAAALWILLRTWTLAVAQLAKRAPEVKPWKRFVQALDLSGEQFIARLKALDGYLEAVEDTLDDWAKQNGG